MKPDFVLYAPETDSVVIVELKNIVTPSRQTGTEISAYANEIKSYIPFISDGDIVSIIISSVWPTLLKHYTFHEIFWQQRNILCLQPIEVDGEVKLKIGDIKSIAEDSIRLKLSIEHLGGYQICLYDDYLNTKQRNRQRLDQYVEQMKTAMTAMATKGDSQKTHGFAFLWKDNFELSIAPYSITIINFAPFQSFERHFHNEEFAPNEIAKKFIEIIQEHDPIGHGASLDAIRLQGQLFLENFCRPVPEGFEKWEILRQAMDDRCELLISFQCWGVFRELYSDKLIQHYKEGDTGLAFDEPVVGLELINELSEPNYDFFNLSYYDRNPDDFDDDLYT